MRFVVFIRHSQLICLLPHVRDSQRVAVDVDVCVNAGHL